MENGIKIMNLEGADILKDNLDGMNINKRYGGAFNNSLLLNKLLDMGLTTRHDTTRDIIMVNFSHGFNNKDSFMRTKGLEEINDKYNNRAKELRKEIKDLEKEKKEKYSGKGSRELKQQFTIMYIDPKKEELNNLSEPKNQEIKDLYEKYPNPYGMDKQEVRDYLYKNGFVLNFGKKIGDTYEVIETIKYKMWFRSPSKARVGDVLFINEKLYEDITKWQVMGLDVAKCNKVVELGSYMSLTSSTIVDKVVIKPNEILVVNDLDAYTDLINVAEVNVDEFGATYVERKKDRVKDTLFDGQALLDDSLFTSNAGMMLLRQHFFKACGFRTYISRFMKDYFGDNYETATVTDRYGNEVRVKDIKMITTENAMKWEKFSNLMGDNPYQYWCDKVVEDGCVFGVCKTDHKSKYNKKQRMSYQMVNSLMLDEEGAIELTNDTVDYINDIKGDDIENYITFLEATASNVNSNAMLVDLYRHNNKFANSVFFRDYRRKETSKYVDIIRGGKLFVEGDNLTVVGNPYVMLLHSVGEVLNDNNVVINGFTDKTLPVVNGAISVYTSRFSDGELLAGFRNPHNAPNNVAYLKNNYSEEMDKYFNFSDNIIAINCINSEISALCNGMDKDSDFLLVTNNNVVVDRAKSFFRSEEFPCIVNSIEQSKKSYEASVDSNIAIDNLLAKAKTAIGESSNLAQIALSLYSSDRDNKQLNDIVVIMSVLAQIAIDNAKRVYAVDVNKEITRLRSVVKDIDKKLPKFFGYIKDEDIKNRLMNDDICTMDYIQKGLDNIKGRKANGHDKKIANSYFIKTSEVSDSKQIDRVMSKIKEYNDLLAKAHIDEVSETEINNKLDEVCNYIGGLRINEDTMIRIVRLAMCEDGAEKKFRRNILNVMYKSHKDVFMSVFHK